MRTDIEIARDAELRTIETIAAKLGISDEYLEHYGKFKGKVNLSINREKLKDHNNGKLILVSGITPTPAGEGKTTTTVGLSDAMALLGHKTTACIREPSLGPCFGMKGGGAGGGFSQVIPMEDINLHFNGDFHAITSAHNLLAACLDNHLHHGNKLNIDHRRIVWNRVLDLNDRALRQVVVGLGGPSNSIPRQDTFSITAASEIMAIFCLSNDINDLRKNIALIIVAYNHDGEPITAADLHVEGAMTALLKDAINPNLAQTLEGNPVFIHGGPFANIAHGCNSIAATKLALKLADYTITEAGFGSDLGAEKFFDIKCRKANLTPNAVVLVATLQSLKSHGGVPLDKIREENVDAVSEGTENLKKHIENIHQFGLPVVVAINQFTHDTEQEISMVKEKCDYLGVDVVICSHWRDGGKGAIDLAKAVVDLSENHKTDFNFLYPDDMSLWNKMKTIATSMYGANNIMANKDVRTEIKRLEDQGFGQLPVCMAKTPASLSTDPRLKGRPTGFDVPIREVRLSSGAGFIVVLTGDVITMPGLPKTPAAENIDVDDKGLIQGLS
ncbi:MAG: formate--tetrahydrofolate ligase [Candidatus Thioglobus autotrophicus]|nr:formate--tetrahydrofolate ligase [Candidatus Thioglobus autotrophicus]